ncbi:MAG TPA: alpha/beta fold hydrolase [Vicinamibacterales bacterium]|nr:alpha/beta fold hydrolase [Vicinamibacterales bacterium]
MTTYPAASDAPVLVFGHGAGAGESHPWMKKVGAGLAARGVTVVTFNFPYMDARRRAPDRNDVLEAAFAAVWREVATAHPGAAMFAGGKSMGGRISSQAAARGLFDPAPRGLAFFGYPLHPPGKPDQRRDKHLSDVAAPMLFLHGTRDPFGSPEEMAALAAGLGSRARLEIIEGGDHSLVATKGADPKGTSVDRAIEVAAGWIRSLAG